MKGKKKQTHTTKKYSAAAPHGSLGYGEFNTKKSQTDKKKIKSERPGSVVFHLGISKLLFLYGVLQSPRSKQGKLLNQIRLLITWLPLCRLPGNSRLVASHFIMKKG